MHLAIRLALWAYLLAPVLGASFGAPPIHFRVGCDGSKTGYFALDPEDITCRSFLRCLPKVVKMQCSPPLTFNIFAESCSWPGNTWCPLKSGGPSGTSSATASPVTWVTTPQSKSAQHQNSSLGACKRVVCYFTSWAQHRFTVGRLLPKIVNPFHCTHLIYAFAELEGNSLKSVEKNDERIGKNGMYRSIVALREKNPSLNVLLAVGGKKMGSEPFINMVATPASRLEFALSTVRFLRKWEFDGIDINWKYPGSGESRAWDKKRFTALLKETLNEFEKEAKTSGRPRLMLTAAVASGKREIDLGYEISTIARYLDFASLLAFDFNSPWVDGVKLHNPLFSQSPLHTTNMEWTANYWVKRGFPKENLVLGLAFFGRTTTFSNSLRGHRYPRGPGNAGMYTKEKGLLAYYEVCRLTMEKTSKVIMDYYGQVPYAVYKDQFISFENPTSLRIKVRYATSERFGGVMIWTLGMDDITGIPCDQGRFPLQKSVISACKEFA